MDQNNACTDYSHGLPSAVGFLPRILVESFFAGHLILAAFYWWLTPKGFPIFHCRFWLNSVLPIAITAVFAFCLVELLRRRFKMPMLCLIVSASAWGTATAWGRHLFPISLSNYWAAGLFPFLTAVACVAILLPATSFPRGLWISSIVVGICLGGFATWVQISPSADTLPYSESLSSESLRTQATVENNAGIRPSLSLDEQTFFYPALQQLTIKFGNVTIDCAPLMSFDRITADRFWSLFAPESERSRKVQFSSTISDGYLVKYNDGSSVEIVNLTKLNSFQLTARSNLPQDTYSHLNRFCHLNVRGHKKLSIAFSPCQESIIEVLPADYPMGRPARFAYLDAEGTFHIVEATSGEKGPFHELASGPLSRGEPLTMRFFDAGKPIGLIRLNDWSSQLSTTISPTAGWQVLVNAIEFQIDDDFESREANIWITLAATSVGRGWECVGHRAGIYRNRMVFEEARELTSD